MNEGEGEGESDLKATETRRRVHCWPPPTPSQWGGPDRPPTAAASSTPSDVKKNWQWPANVKKRLLLRQSRWS